MRCGTCCHRNVHSAGCILGLSHKVVKGAAAGGLPVEGNLQTGRGRVATLASAKRSRVASRAGAASPTGQIG